MELRDLRYFRVVAEELHFGRAAARLHMEPQPLNFRIKQLERELGFTLLSHRENRTQLTAAGAAFLADAEALLAAADRAVEHGKLVASGESGRLRVGYVSPVMHTFLIPAIKRFRADFPEVSFDLQTLRPKELERGLNHQELDLGLTVLPAPDDNFESFTFARVQPVVAVASDDPLARRESVSWGDLHGRDAISLGRRYPAYEQRIEALLSEHGVELRIVQYADDVEAALAFVAIGLGITLLHLPRAQCTSVSFVALSGNAAPAEFAAIWRRHDDQPLRARFVATLDAVANTDALRIPVSIG